MNKKIKKIPCTDSLSLLHLNIRSLNSKVNEFCLLIDSFEIDLDVIILSEIWTTNIEFHSNILNNYVLFTDLPNTSAVGGVGIFIKKSLQVQQRHDLKLPVSDKSRVENLWVEVTKDRCKFLIAGLYRHPDQNITEFTKSLEVNLAKLSQDKIPCIIAGDVNIDLLKFNLHVATEEYLHNLLLNNFLPSLLLPTRITESSSTLIDHIYVYQGAPNMKDSWSVLTGNLFYEISDHLPNIMYMCKNNNKKINYKDRPYIRLYTPKNKQHFLQEINCIRWHDVFSSSSDVDVCYDAFTSVLKLKYEECFPLVRLSRRAVRDKKWFTAALKTSCKHKNALYKKWLATRNANDKIEFSRYKKVFTGTCENS